MRKQLITYRFISIINDFLLVLFIVILAIFLAFMLEPGMFFSLVYKVDTTQQLKEVSNYLNTKYCSQDNQANYDCVTQADSFKENSLLKNNSTQDGDLSIINVKVSNQDLSDSDNKLSQHLYKNFKFQSLHAVLNIPAINVKGVIVSGSNEHLMEKGFWHVNANGAWLEFGNVVIFGHRYFHLPPFHDTFFNLDKVQKGDQIRIETDIGTWIYTVTDIRVVDRNDFSVFENTQKPQLTLVTCHPLWTSRKRLVVHAKLSNTLYIN